MLLAISAHEPPQALGLEMASASPGALESLLAYWIRPHLIFIYLFFGQHTKDYQCPMYVSFSATLSCPLCPMPYDTH